jgi:phosphoribosylanthranilate isomerase
MAKGDFLIKICGITNQEDALASVQYGANALGFNFYRPSPRYTDPGEVESILGSLSGQILKVAVVVVSSGDVHHTIEDISSRVPSLDAFQLHGLKSESEVPSLPRRFLVATSPAEVKSFPHHEIVIDTSWGTGQKADWELLSQLAQSFILSGGLDPENVGEAIQSLRPAGVDVCSGVEQSPGIKDQEKLKRFIERSVAAAPGDGTIL